jgi:hypothetical protein
MKNIKFIYFVFPIAFTLFSSCSDSLTETPTTFYSEESIYASPEGVDAAINGLYYELGSFDGYGSGIINLMLPHSGLFYSSQLANVDVTGLNANTSNINLTKSWETQYKAINLANIAIKNLESKPAEFKNRDNSLGHAYFIRGKVYLDLLRAYGGVPLRIKPANIDELHLPRASKQDVTAQIIDDLNKAKALMPNISEKGRPSKYAAYAYLAKLYMFLAMEDKSKWNLARTELQTIIDSQKFKLTPTYAELFKPGNENTVESIFELQYGITGGSRTSDHIRIFTPSNSIYTPSNIPTFGRLRPNKEVYDDHKNRYPTDPRINATFLANEYLRNNGTKQSIYPKQKTGNNGFPVIAKWFDPNFNGTTTERNYILVRYADVLLMMAEVVNEIDGPQAAYDYVNQVLARARDINGDGVSDSDAPAAWSGMTQDQFRIRIMLERRYELLSEGEEWFDTRRRGPDFLDQYVFQPHNNNPTFDPSKDFKYKDKVKNMLLPIPLSEISGNQEIGPEDQNPGY